MVHGRWSTRPSAICHQPLAISHDVLARRTSHSPPRTSHVAPLHIPPPSLPPHLPMYTRVSNMSPRRYLPALFLLFVGSGCAALIYEVVWFQLLQLVIGSSAISLGILLGTFMGGMCAGSLLLPRVVSSRHHPLRVYASIELAIGAIGILVLFVMPLVGRVYIAWGGEGLTGLLLRGV